MSIVIQELLCDYSLLSQYILITCLSSAALVYLKLFSISQKLLSTALTVLM